MVPHVDSFLPVGNAPAVQCTAFIVAVLAGYLASMIESFGDYHACKPHGRRRRPHRCRRLSRGIGIRGRRLRADRRVWRLQQHELFRKHRLGGPHEGRQPVRGAVCRGSCSSGLGLFGKFGAIATAIPQPVVGGLYCVMFGLISGRGRPAAFAKADLNSDRNLLISGFALFMGLSVPAYFNSEAGAAAACVESPGDSGQLLGAHRQNGHGGGGDPGHRARQPHPRHPRSNAALTEPPGVLTSPGGGCGCWS